MIYYFSDKLLNIREAKCSLRQSNTNQKYPKMLASPVLLLTIMVASLHAELICPPVSQGDMANFFPNEDGKCSLFIIQPPIELFQTVVVTSCVMLASTLY